MHTYALTNADTNTHNHVYIHRRYRCGMNNVFLE